MTDERVVATPVWARAMVWSLIPGAGAALGWVVHELPAWVLRIPFAPMKGPFRLAARLPEPEATLGAMAAGAVLGLVLAHLVDKESLTVKVTSTEVVLVRPGVRHVLPRHTVAAAYSERDHVVLLASTGKELAREPSHLGRQRLAALFGPIWSEADPYANSYLRWVPGSPDLPAGVQALFAARQRALDKGDTDDARQLRGDLGRLGFVVRDEKKRQHFRRTDAG
ncbi:hypothetical protein [Actinoplanes sp. NPDC051494]|uniref:YqeB family protein n=1 Tax=Actinoplanes sp. NPDC051494 TaxID=3363907 RepID=UPI003797EB21